ncbi:transcriptional regulator [Cupriavidus sp. TA19]|uniref:LysR family transcriptional regulator n=1 Tax=unclassified Cupriavidus TaxID=2640874 RepID=UPI002729443B|nr:LysR family transcriptional regulator [Cupriavidus sp. TA19]GLC92649.1 transcriptional regulator [Cupriavidus sp. TA19]
MHLKHLRHLLMVADVESFSRAAQRLHLTQSALSRSIQALEDELGGKLIDRHGRRNVLTPLGELIAERARRMLFEEAELHRSVELFHRHHLGAIRVGLGAGPGAVLMTPFLRHMAMHHPGIQVAVSLGTSDALMIQLRQRTLDAVIVEVTSVAPATDLRHELLAQLQGRFICRAGHPLLQQAAAGDAVTFDDVMRYPLASAPLSPEVARGLVKRFGPRADPEHCLSLRCENVRSLVEAVLVSDAILFSIVAAVRTEIAEGKLCELVTTPAVDDGPRYAFFTLAGRTEAPSMALFRRFVDEHLHD